MNYDEAVNELFKHFKLYLKAKLGIDLSDISRREVVVESNLKSCNYCKRKLYFSDGGLHSYDVALKTLLCESKGIPRKEYCYGLDVDGYHLNFCYTELTAKALESESKYHLLELVRIRAMSKLGQYFNKRNEISKEELDKIIEKALKEEVDEEKKAREDLRKKLFGALSDM